MSTPRRSEAGQGCRSNAVSTLRSQPCVERRGLVGRILRHGQDAESRGAGRLTKPLEVRPGELARRTRRLEHDVECLAVRLGQGRAFRVAQRDRGKGSSRLQSGHGAIIDSRDQAHFASTVRQDGRRSPRGRRRAPGALLRRARAEAGRRGPQDAADPAVEPLRSPLRPLVRRRLYEGLGREERDGRDRRPHHADRDQRAGRGRGRRRPWARPLPLRLAAGRLRGAGDRSLRRRSRGRAAPRTDDRARAEVHARSENGEVLRVLRLLRARPRQLPHRPVDRGRLPERTKPLGGPAGGRAPDQGAVRQSGGARTLAGGRQQHGAAGAPLVLRRRRTGRAGARGAGLARRRSRRSSSPVRSTRRPRRRRSSPGTPRPTTG